MSYPAAMTRFLSAPQYAVVGASADRAKWSNKVLRWYQDRKLKVTPINPTAKSIEGLDAVPSAAKIVDLPSTSVSIIINPTAGLPIIKELFGPDKTRWPHAVWFQPGAFDDAIKNFVKEIKAEDRVVPFGECILVTGDGVRSSMQIKPSL